jgi:hypothetical protein
MSRLRRFTGLARTTACRPIALENLSLSLVTKHSMLLGLQDVGFPAGRGVLLGAELSLAVEEQHAQEVACGIEALNRDHADQAGLIKDVVG